MGGNFTEQLRRYATALLCPRCKAALLYAQAVPGAQDHLYCPDCQDMMYDPEQGAMLVIGELTYVPQ
jgi:Zn finger protein HypA/HybF involved in hydrogenase expression